MTISKTNALIILRKIVLLFVAVPFIVLSEANCCFINAIIETIMIITIASPTKFRIIVVTKSLFDIKKLNTMSELSEVIASSEDVSVFIPANC